MENQIVINEPMELSLDNVQNKEKFLNEKVELLKKNDYLCFCCKKKVADRIKFVGYYGGAICPTCAPGFTENENYRSDEDEF